MMFILPCARDAAFLERLRSASENCFAFFRRRWCSRKHHPMCRVRGKNPHRENKMKQLLKLSAAPATALFALAYLAMATPATAGPSEYCRQDVTSGMRSCSFETLEQCQAMSSGRGANCYENPFPDDASAKT